MLLRVLALLLGLGLGLVAPAASHAVTVVGTATITGHILNPDSSPYKGGGSLTVYRTVDGVPRTDGFSASVADDGSYVIDVQLFASTEAVRVGLGPTGVFDEQFWSATPPAWTLADATDISLSVGATATGKDFTLAQNPSFGTIGGVVTDTATPTPNPVATSIKLYPDCGATPVPFVPRSDQATGAWSTRVPAGSYCVSFSEDPNDAWSTVWSGGAATKAAASPVVVTGGGSTSGVNAQVVPDPAQTTMGGTVTDRDGLPIVGVLVTIYDLDVPADTHKVATDPAGHWSTGVADGRSYKVGFSVEDNDLWVAQWWQNAATLADATVVGPHSANPPLVLDAQLAALPITNVTSPTVSGVPIVGRTLTASGGTWDPAGVTLHYQWLADGTPIAGATSRTFVLTKAQAGHRVGVQVTATKTGYASATATSAATRVVKAVPKLRLTATAMSDGRTLLRVSATAVVPVTGQVQLFDGSRLLSTGRLVDGKRSVAVRLARGTHHLRAHYLGSLRVLAATVRLTYTR
jgi:hypothetical protein